MPIAPDPGIEAGFKAADQQSYLQQVLANTKATQEQQAQLKQKAEEMYVDPTAFQHGDGAKLASGATPDGKLIFNSPTHFAQARSIDESKYKEKVGLDTNEAVANNAVRAGLVDPTHPAWSAVQMATARKPLDSLSTKHLEDIGVMVQQQAKGARGLDRWGRPVTEPNTPIANGGMPFDPVKAEAEGKEITEHYDKEGNVTYALRKTVDSGDSLQSFIKANYDNRSMSSLSSAELKKARADWVLERRGNKGGDIYVTTGANLQAKQDAPVGKDINQYWLPPSDKFPQGMFASSVPGASNMSRAELERMGAKNTAEWGKPENVVEARNRDKAAFGHLQQLRDFLLDPRNEDLFPSADKGGLTAVTQARMRQAWAGIVGQSDPRYAVLDALDKTSLNLLAGIAPTTGNRLGYQIMVHMASGLPAAYKLPWTRESAAASIQGLAAALAASAKSRLPTQMVDQTMREHGFMSDSVTAGLPPAGTGGMPGVTPPGRSGAGVSGSVAGWGYKGVR